MHEAFTAVCVLAVFTDDNNKFALLLCYLVKVAGPVKRDTM